MLAHIEIRDANAHATHNAVNALAECGVQGFISSYYDELHIDVAVPGKERHIVLTLLETLSHYGLHAHSVTH